MMKRSLKLNAYYPPLVDIVVVEDDDDDNDVVYLKTVINIDISRE
jgi:hypothetical protein